MGIIATIVSQHLEEAAFLWLLRSSAVHRGDYHLADLARLDLRLEAHIDGLGVAGAEVWPFVTEALEMKGPGEAFIASLVAFKSGRADWIDAVMSAVRISPALYGAAVSALGWLPSAEAMAITGRMITSWDPPMTAIAVRAASIHRNGGDWVSRAIGHADPSVVWRACRAAGELGRSEDLYAISEHASSDDPAVRYWSSWALIRLGSRKLAGMMQIANSASPYRHHACLLLMRVLARREALVFWRGITDPRDSVSAAGALGDPVLVPSLLERLEDKPLARLAGAAFSTITGVDLAYLDLDAKETPEYSSGPTEQADDENVQMDPDEHLDWPNARGVQAWWNAHAAGFEEGRRYMAGLLIAKPNLDGILRTGTQVQRHAAALELALGESQRAVFETRAPGFAQQKLLGLPVSYS